MKKLLSILMFGILFLASSSLAEQVLVNPNTDRIAFNCNSGYTFDIYGAPGLYIKNNGNWYCITETSSMYKTVCAYVLSCMSSGTSFYLAEYGIYDIAPFTSNSFPVKKIVAVQNVKYW
jgi:hypothetical protein